MVSRNMPAFFQAATSSKAMAQAASVSAACRIVAPFSPCRPGSEPGTRWCRKTSRSTLLQPVFDEPKGAIEHLLIGTGPTLMPLARSLREKLAESGISAETMATGAAARTYSILLAEDRRVAAALLAVP